MAERSRREVKKNQDLQRILHMEKERSRMRMIRKILKKPSTNRTGEETEALDAAPDLVEQIQNSIKKLKCIKERAKEVVDDTEVLSTKCAQLAKAIKESSFTVIYSGAGISTSAHIPDYRGPDGVWTLLQKGKEITLKDLSLAEPTFTHMAIKQLYKEGLVSHVVSQNCDGLHIRSGLAKTALSELHGNMFIEVCPKCKPLMQYVRLFDVTEKTGLHRHRTGRSCSKCSSELNDTIVHFGEKGKLQWPMNWKGAVKAVSKADLIICLGSSLKVLRRYPGLWRLDQPLNKRPKLFIVNLQWTPKDTQATLKIHGKCDEVMEQVMSFLDVSVPEYKREDDPIFRMATPLLPDELTSTTRLMLMKKEAQLTEFCVLDHKNRLSEIKIELKAELENSTNREELLLSFDLEQNLQPHVKLLDINSNATLIKLNAEQIDNRTYIIKDESLDRNGGQAVPRLSGWYGKGCAKWKKYRKRTNSTCKRQKVEACEDDVIIAQD